MEYINLNEIKEKLRELRELRKYFDSENEIIFDYNKKIRDIYYNLLDDDYYNNMFIIINKGWLKYINKENIINFRLDGDYFDGFDLLWDYEGSFDYKKDNLICWFLEYYKINIEEYEKRICEYE